MNNKTGRRETNLVAFGGKIRRTTVQRQRSSRSQIAKIRLVCVALAGKYEKLVIWRVEIVVVDVNAVDLSCQFRFAEPSSSSSLELLSPSFHPFYVPFPTKLRAQHTHFSSSSFHPVRLVCVYSPAHLLDIYIDYIYLIEKDLYTLTRSSVDPFCVPFCLILFHFDTLRMFFFFYYFPPSCGLIIITVTVRIDFGRVASTTS